MAAAVPTDQTTYGEWRRNALMKTLDAKDQMRFTTPDANAVVQAETSAANNTASNARQAADNAASRAVQTRGQNMTDSRSRETAAATRENTAALRAEKTAERKATADDKAVTKFSTDLQREGVPEIEAALSGAEAVFSKHTKNGKLGDVPGIGRLTNVLPDWAVSGEGADVRESLAAAANIVLSARSGAAVTDQELRRLARELSIGANRSAEDTQRAYQKFRARFETVKANLAAGVSDEVKGEYEARGGVKIQRGGGAGVKPATGTLSPAEATELAELRKRFPGGRQ